MLRVHNGPNGRILRSQTPNGETGRLISTGSPHLVVGCNRVEKPNRVVCLVVFVILVIGIFVIGVKRRSGGRLTSMYERLLESYLVAFRFTCGPIVPVISQRENRFSWIQLAHSFDEIGLIPI